MNKQKLNIITKNMYDKERKKYFRQMQLASRIKSI